MIYTEVAGLRLSKLALGTVQLGLEYGVANRTGRPDGRAAQAILALAAASGVNAFDTAPAYGASEEILGEFLASHQDAFGAQPPVVVTKLSGVELDGEPSRSAVRDAVCAALERSARRLRLSPLPICLMHHAADMTRFRGLVAESLVRAKEQGLVERVGVSVYSPDEVERFLDTEGLDAIQVPINLFDHRLVEGGQLRRLAERGTVVFARSVFLQGLFFLEPEGVPAHVVVAREPLRQLRSLAAEWCRPIAELAVAFVRDLPGVASLVIGVETAAQLAENLRLMGCPPLPDEARAAIHARFAGLPEALVNPATWDRRKAAR
jgi:aryl-alcohol dehydrogenase-like predicted oxidoreductase